MLRTTQNGRFAELIDPEGNPIQLSRADLATQFVQAHLVDELHVGIAPVLVGSGTQLQHAKAYTPWKLAQTQQHGDFLALRYLAPGRDAGTPELSGRAPALR